MSVAQRSFGREATEGNACTRGAGSTAALAHLPALDLEQALDGVLVLTQQPGNGTVASIRQIGDHPLYPRRQVLIDPGFGFGRPIVITAAGHTGPAAGLHHRPDIALGNHLGHGLIDQSSVESRWRCNFLRNLSSSMASP